VSSETWFLCLFRILSDRATALLRYPQEVQYSIDILFFMAFPPSILFPYPFTRIWII